MFSPEARRKASEAYAALSPSPLIPTLCEKSEVFLGSVYFGARSVPSEVLASEFARMRSLHYNTVRFYTCYPLETAPGQYDFRDADRWFAAAEKAGIGVILHTEWMPWTEAALERHGIADEADLFERAPDDPAYRALIDERYGPVVEHYRDHPALYGWGLLGEPEPALGPLESPRLRRAFGQWLKREYGTLEALDAAWNIYSDGRNLLLSDWSGKDLDYLLDLFKTGARISGVHRMNYNYGAARDVSRFLAWHLTERARVVVESVRARDDKHPITSGAHQLFANQAFLRWHVGDWAKLGDFFHTSIHLSWHFELVEGEVDRPVYLQSRLTRDFNKGGMTSAYETTGGPVQHSGGYGNAMTAGLMRRLMLSYLAAGNHAINFWVWNPRPGGWEAGEYGLTGLDGSITPWAEETGRVGRHLFACREELWQAEPDPPVGLLYSWDTEAVLTMEPQRHDLREATPGRFGRGTLQQHQRALAGAGRALINAHLPFEYVEPEELARGLAARYPVLVAAGVRALSEDDLATLRAYVEEGGRLIADVPFAFVDRAGKLRHTGEDRAHAELFGAWPVAIHDTRTRARAVNRLPLSGLFAELETTDGTTVLARFEDGSPAITEHRLGRGSAVLAACELGRECLKPGNTAMEALLAGLCQPVEQLRGWHAANVPMVHCRRSPKADHFFLLNDGAATTALLTLDNPEAYTAATDLLEERDLPLGETLEVDLAAESGTWLRLVRK